MQEHSEIPPTPPADEPEAPESRPACNLNALFDGILDNDTVGMDEDEEE